MKNQQFPIEPIGYYKAAKYLSALKTKNFTDPEMFNLGGTFRAREISKWVHTKGFSGLMCWFCWDESSNDRKLFLALEPKFGFNYPQKMDDCEEHDAVKDFKIENEMLLVPIQYFDKDPLGDGDLEQKLRGHWRFCFPRNRWEKASQVKIWNCSFLKKDNFLARKKIGFTYFSAIDPKDRTLDPKQPERNYLKEFFKQEGMWYVRFYFGYDDGADPNFIRVILVPTNFWGKNIQTASGYSLGKLNDQNLLQTSWPPYSEKGSFK